MARRVAPPAGSGRKPQWGRRGGARLGPRLAHVLHLWRGDGRLEAVAAQETALWSRPAPEIADGGQRPTPRPLTEGVRLGSAAAGDAAGPFDPHRATVAIAFEFFGAAADLAALGAACSVRAGDFFVGWANLDRVEEFARHPATQRIELLRKPLPASAAISPPVPAAVPPPEVAAPFTGRGVQLAVVDLGFDFLHPTFLRATEAGGEEVRALWLYDTALATTAGSGQGRRFSRQELDAALAWFRSSDPTTFATPPDAFQHLKRLDDAPVGQALRNDLVYHGTAVAGVAAGNGRSGAAQPGRVGVAPEADLLFIAIGLHDETRFADSPQIAAAFTAAFEEDDTPCVVLMANSDNLGPHDGSLCGERFLDELLLVPGRAIVLTSGNLNHPQTGAPDAAWHGLAEPGAAGAKAVLHLRVADGATWPDSAEVWFDSEDAESLRVTVSCVAASGAVAPTDIGLDEAPRAVLAPADDPAHHSTVEAVLQFDEAADSYCLHLTFLPAPDGALSPALWTIELPASGPVHGWIDRNNNGLLRWEGDAAKAGAAGVTLGSPDVALRPLTVGSAGRDPKAGLRMSDFSGRGSLRQAAHSKHRKPDLVGIGEAVAAPVGRPNDRCMRIARTGPALFSNNYTGTSFAAPQVAGACALLFEKFGADPDLGSVATWVDLRQAILQAAQRPPGLPPADAEGWDPAGGYGLLDLDALLRPGPVDGADPWLAKSAHDTGAEPFVAATFWDSPALALEDGRLRVTVANRGAAAADLTVSVWWSRFGILFPLPDPADTAGPWSAAGFSIDGTPGNTRAVAAVAPDGVEEVVFGWTGPALPTSLIATVDSAGDRYDPASTLCAQNNAAALGVVRVEADGALPPFTIVGSDDTDGAIIWLTGTMMTGAEGRIHLDGLPVAALPWRDAAMFAGSGLDVRPLHGEAGAEDDPAGTLSRMLSDAASVTAVTDIVGADALTLEQGRVGIAAGAKLTLPRLRIARGAPLEIRIRIEGGSGGGAVHLLHLSGGRRVGGGTIQF